MAQYAILIVLIVLVIALFVTSYLRRKRYNNELGQMREELKIGDKVMTDTGVVGEVVDSFEEEGYKYFVLKSGRGNNVGFFTVHANAVYYVFGKEEPQKQNMANVKKEKKGPAKAETQPAEGKPTETAEQAAETESKTANSAAQPTAETALPKETKPEQKTTKPKSKKKK